MHSTGRLGASMAAISMPVTSFLSSSSSTHPPSCSAFLSSLLTSFSLLSHPVHTGIRPSLFFFIPLPFATSSYASLLPSLPSSQLRSFCVSSVLSLFFFSLPRPIGIRYRFKGRQSSLVRTTRDPPFCCRSSASLQLHRTALLSGSLRLDQVARGTEPIVLHRTHSRVRLFQGRPCDFSDLIDRPASSSPLLLVRWSFRQGRHGHGTRGPQCAGRTSDQGKVRGSLARLTDAVIVFDCIEGRPHAAALCLSTGRFRLFHRRRKRAQNRRRPGFLVMTGPIPLHQGCDRSLVILASSLAFAGAEVSLPTFGHS